MNPDPHRVTDHAVLDSIVTTLRTQIVPALDDAWARAAAIQLAALAEVIRDRPPDPAAERAHELSALLVELGRPGSDTWPSVSYDAALAASSSALAAWGVDDDRRHRLRGVLVRHLDEDLQANLPLLAAFRGQLPDA